MVLLMAGKEDGIIKTIVFFFSDSGVDMLYNVQLHLKSIFGKLIGEREIKLITTGDKTTN